MKNEKVTVFWFRRDLRLDDNPALHYALRSGSPVLPIFIFDDNIVGELPKNDARVSFIYDTLENIHSEFKKYNSGVRIFKGDPLAVFNRLTQNFEIQALYFNKDFEPYGMNRDERITRFIASRFIPSHRFTDHLIQEPGKVLKADGKPYTVFTPFKKAWLNQVSLDHFKSLSSSQFENLAKTDIHFPERSELGMIESNQKIKPFTLDHLEDYGLNRDYPDRPVTSLLGPHLRFGTVSIRSIFRKIGDRSDEFLGELIWREFFMHILFHYPHVIHRCFKPAYEGIPWRNDPADFERWKEGKTGIPLVDAGMRQLNQTGFMHNRVRMVVAAFLTKNLLIDWRKGEAYFARKLHDFELSSNNGNWQWAAGSGCDAAPYFRIFNPITQQKKFDPEFRYIKQWVPEYGTPDYPEPMVDLKASRKRALATYGVHLSASRKPSQPVLFPAV
jgi:deoxyribodipyrimidine photo-lyase